MYLALGIFYLLLALAIAGVIVFTMARAAKEREEVLSKKNLFYLAPAFLIIYLLYLTASAYNGGEIDIFFCFSLVNDTLDTLKFKIKKDIILPICKAHPIYYVDFVLAFALGGATVILSVCSFFGQRLRNYFAGNRLLKKGADIVIGDSKDALKYAAINGNCVIWGAKITRRRYGELLKEGSTIIKAPLCAKSVLRKLKKGEHNIIAFRDGSYSYTEVISVFTELRKGGCNVFLNLEANQEEKKVIKEKFISKAEADAAPYLSCFSKYELIARRFVSDYPITKFIPRTFYNENCTLKNGKDINVVFIGFGKVNYQLFRLCSMQFQFAAEKNGKLVSKPVRYFICDNSEKMLHNEFFSHIEFEFDEQFKNCDFPKPERICDINVIKTDANSVKAKKKFKSLVGENSYTYFIISLENDLEDASYARTISRLFDDGDNFRVFVRAKNNSGETLNNENDAIIYFGEEKKIYTHDSVVNDDLTELAQRLNLLYSNISNSPQWLEAVKNRPADEQYACLTKALQGADNKRLMRKKWAELPMIEQASNLYHALNLPFKLNLLGFGMVKKSQTSFAGITEAEFDKRYVNSGRAQNYSDYSFFFKTESSNVLAFSEHSRWNALYILYDYKQMKKSEMQMENVLNADGSVTAQLAHKNTDKKVHACITTYYGIDELIKFKYFKLYGEDATNLNYADDERLRALGKLYAYDYMDLDRLYAEITSMGYILVDNLSPQA